MRICMLIYYYWPKKAGGAESQCRKLVRQMCSIEHDITVVTSRYCLDVLEEETTPWEHIVRLAIFELVIQRFFRMVRGKGSTPKIVLEETIVETKDTRRSVLRFFKEKIGGLAANLIRYLNILVFCAHLLLFLRKNRNTFDVIHVHTADWIAGVATIAGKLFGVPVVCKGADTPVFPRLSWVPFARVLDTWRRKPYFIALTVAMRDDLTANGVQEEMIEVIPNGVEIPVSVSAPGSNTTFLFLGNFSQTAAHKGFDVLLQAWAKVKDEGVQAQLILAGDGDSREWKALSEELKINDSVQFPGFCNDTEKLFMESCCLILPSRKEGLSNALLEAQSYGLPAVTSDIPGNREVVVDGETGIIIPVGDVRALADAIMHLYDNVLLREEYGRAARDRMNKIFSIDTIALRVELLYRRIVL